MENLTSAGQKAVDWLTEGVTLQDDTKYIIVTFKKTTTESFSDSELHLLRQALRFVPEIPDGVNIPTSGVLKEDHFVRLEDTWLTDTADRISIGKNSGYNMCYLPVALSD